MRGISLRRRTARGAWVFGPVAERRWRQPDVLDEKANGVHREQAWDGIRRGGGMGC
jgi:hypothetical protein